VARLALDLFDSAKRIHGLGTGERELLECAALLHDVGASVNRSKHHRHSQYLILHSPLPGFEREEVRWIATIARFHRGAPPKLTHEDLEDFDPEVRRRIIRLAAILRVADGLDHSHQAIVRRLRLARLNGRDVIEIDAAGREPLLELWAARRRADLWERCFGVELGLRVQRSSGRNRRQRVGRPASESVLAIGGARRRVGRKPQTAVGAALSLTPQKRRRRLPWA
jgi:exopolyphosphatase/guanosine-5'-triphosphate,3'-diphosphate pyrophosphatase